MKIEATKGKSPYAKHQKRPFAYSDQYHRWSRSMADNGPMSAETIAADSAFRRAFGVPAASQRSILIAEDFDYA